MKYISYIKHPFAIITVVMFFTASVTHAVDDPPPDLISICAPLNAGDTYYNTMWDITNYYHGVYENTGDMQTAAANWGAQNLDCPGPYSAHNEIAEVGGIGDFSGIRYICPNRTPETKHVWAYTFNPACVIPVPPDDIYLGYRKGCPVDTVGNPVSVYNGNNFEEQEDIRIQSPQDLDLVFKRYYNSQSDEMSAIGYGWTHSYSAKILQIEIIGSQYLKIRDQTGRSIYFQEESAGVWEGAFEELTHVIIEEGGYSWHTLEGNILHFQAEGELSQGAVGSLIWIDDSYGNRLTLTYDTQDRLQTVTDNSSNRVLTFHYDANDRISQISGPVTAAISDGIWTQYTYTQDDNIESVTYADGSGYLYGFTDSIDSHNLTSKKDGLENTMSTWTYDSLDRVVSSFTRDGNGVSINYISSQKIEVTDAYGITRTYNIRNIKGVKRLSEVIGPADCSTCNDGIVRYAYDGEVRIIETESANGLINQYDNYDARGNPQTKVLAVGTPDEKAITYTFHPYLNEKLTKTEQSVLGVGNKFTTWDYDDDGNAAPNENPTHLIHRIIEQGFTRDASGSVIPYEYITVLTYNGKGQVLSIDGPQPGNQDLTSFSYNPATGDIVSVTQPLVGTTTYSAYDATGQAGRATDPNGNSILYSYDGRGRVLTTTTEADGSTTTFQYNDAGDIERIIQANGVTTDYTYDSTYGRLTRTTDTLGNYIEYSYDAQGNRTQESFYNPSEERQFWMRYDFQGPDRPGKLWKEILPDDTHTEYSYTASGDIGSVTDPSDKVTAYEYDILKRLSIVIQPGAVITGYTYDSQDNLTAVTDPENLTTTYTYNDMGRVVSTTSPDTGITSYVYDEAGNLISRIDANGITVTYIYDSLNRLTSVQFPDASQNIIYTYDQGTNGKGRMTGMTDPSGSYQYIYDEQGRLISEEKTVDGVIYTTGYSYDDAGLLTGMTYPDGRSITYERDTAGRVARVTTALGGSTRTLAENIDYLPFGPMKNLTYGNGNDLSRQFDQLYRLTHLTTGSLQQVDYTLDSIGNITAITDHLDPARSQTFGYDDLYRLTSSTGVYGSTGYTYDKVGNRLTRDENGQADTYAYAAGSHRLSQITGANPLDFSHDAVGNILTQGLKTFAYNQNNRLVSVTEGGTVTGEYVYNGNGQRIKKTTDDGTAVFHYDQYGNMIGESDTDGLFTTQYVYLGNTRLAAITGVVTTEITVQVTTSLGRNLSGVSVYAFTDTGSYTGKSAVTDTEGFARFTISDFADGSYKFRADYLSDQFWSENITLPGDSAVSIQIAEETTTVQVTQGGSPEAGVKVYLFNDSDTYLGLYETTDENGEVSFILPIDQSFKFRADVLGSQFYSETVTVVGGGANNFTVDSGGGTLTIALDRGDGTPMEGVSTYLFSALGTYLGLVEQTDALGESVFEVPEGTYKIRADYLGYQFWTGGIAVTADQAAALSIPHQDVTITVQGDDNGDVEPRADINVYLFTSSGAYMDKFQTTDASGQALFSLPEQEYKVRADYLNQQYWSDPFIQTDRTVTIPECRVEVTVTRLNNPLSDVPVYVSNDAGSYLNLNDTTDASGQVLFRLPSGEYNFRADYLDSQYFSGNTFLVAHQLNPVTVSTGGGNFTLIVQKAVGDPMAGLSCYLYSADGSYLGHHTVSNDLGEAPFELADGSYKIRIDYLGYQFWTQDFTIPDIGSVTHTIDHQDVTITVQRDYDGVVPGDSINVYLFTSAGSYLNIYKTTDSQGQVVFNLPGQEYKVRVDYLSVQYWSDVFNQVDQTVTINEGMASITVSQGASALENVPVYVFTSSGSYLNINGNTDASGQVDFILPEGTYKFRADYQDSQYWTTEALTAHQINNIALNTGGGTFVLTVEKAPGNPMIDVPVYVFTQSGSYLGINAQTDSQGQVSFDLSDESYKFRVDYMGYQFWSNIVTVPGMLSDTLTIPHQDITVTVNEVYNANYTPIENINVYLFTSSGSYMSIYQATDSLGQVTFNLPEQDYKVRADYLSGQYWSELFNTQNVDVDIAHGFADIHVTDIGMDVYDAPVYLFTDTGSYLGRMERTDSAGRAGFLLPARSYKFRVDHNGSQYWSDVINILADEETGVSLALDLLALDLTNDPNPVRFDGIPPVKETDPVLLASLFDIPGILTQAIVANTGGGDIVYYFINDHLGTPKKIMDESGQVVWEVDYKPFGEASVTSLTIENRFRFTGQYFDEETGLHYNYHRYYDPTTGRYLTPDPIGLAGGINLFIYAQNNPINWIDPEGLYVWGINLGGSFTGFGMKGGSSTALLFDHRGNFAVVTTQEVGAGKGKAAGLFNNVVWGDKDATVFDYAGTGISASGSYGKFTSAVTMPIYGDDEKLKLFYEVGFSPISKGSGEVGVTITFGQVVYHNSIFGEAGKWWGNFFYDLFHPEEARDPCE